MDRYAENRQEDRQETGNILSVSLSRQTEKTDQETQIWGRGEGTFFLHQFFLFIPLQSYVLRKVLVVRRDHDPLAKRQIAPPT